MARIRQCHECEGFGYVVETLEDDDVNDQYDFIRKCIVCNVYQTDVDAAIAYCDNTGKELRWAKIEDEDGTSGYHPCVTP